MKVTNPTILIVDDDNIFMDVLRFYLEVKKAIPVAAYTIADAKEYLLTNQPDFIILDSNLPDGLGIELLSTIKQTGLDTPVLLATSEDDQNVMTRYFELGVTEYMLKPLNLDLMWIKLMRLLETSYLQRKVAIQTYTLQRLLAQKQQEEQLARHVYEHMANKGQQQNDSVRSLMRSSSAFDGDFLISARAPSGSLMTLLLDATGHGLAAAISVLPLTSIFRTMVQKGLALPIIIFELNRKIEQDMPDDRFVAGIMVEINPQTNTVSVWNGGMPDVLVLDNDDKLVKRLKSEHMALGILDAQDFDSSTQELLIDEVGHLILLSDGLVEQNNFNKQPFGLDNLVECITNCENKNNLVDCLDNAFSAFVGGQELEDDVSFCHINVKQLMSGNVYLPASHEGSSAFGSIELKMNVSGGYLANFDLIGGLNHLMVQTDVPAKLRQKAFTVISELANNALDHGVLALDSELKSDEDGFLNFMLEREERLKAIKAGDKIDLTLKYNQSGNDMYFAIEDSGAGYSPSNVVKASNELSGRGLNLINKLSKQVNVHKPGNKTSVVIS